MSDNGKPKEESRRRGFRAITTNAFVPSSPDQPTANVGDRLALNSVLTDRLNFGYRIGFSHGSDGQDRDYYKVLGYNRYPDVEYYMARYRYQDIAKRIIDLPPQDTWAKAPVLIDGNNRSDSEDITSEFLKGWQQLTTAGDEDSLNCLSYFERVDRLAGLGEYGIILLGAKDGQELDQPITKILSGPADLLYLSVYSQVSVDILDSDIDLNPQSKRFGKPNFYQVYLGGSTLTLGGYQRVHYSRIIHVAEDLLEDEIYGLPRLESVVNRLDDLMKVVGGAAEATWKLMRKGLVLLAREGFNMPEAGSTEAQSLDDQLYKYDHDLTRILKLAGTEAKELGSEVVDPDKIFNVIVACISAATGIPQRILLGSERGELASSQDQGNWASVINSRQLNFAEPIILRPFVNWCIKRGVLPKPKSGKYKVEWPPMFQQSEAEKSDIASKYSNAIGTYVKETGAVNVVDPNEFRQQYLHLPPKDESEFEPDEPEETPEDQAAFDEIEQMRQELDDQKNDNKNLNED